MLNLNPNRHLLFLLFGIAVSVNYLWELLQSPFYIGMQVSARMLGHCFLASLGDGVMVLFIYLVSCLIFRQQDLRKLGIFWRAAVTVLIGFIVGVIVESVGVDRLQRWTYNTLMPLLPGSDLGLIPVLQMAILPPIIFLITGRWMVSKSAC